MFKISKFRNTWVMQADLNMTTSLVDDSVFNWSYRALEDLIEELQDKPDVRRMGYDMWYWKNKNELDKFITYWCLKYEQQRSL
jgi:hypothetical protein